jgi:Zn-dependent M28 family amino/carboxypeptidase
MSMRKTKVAVLLLLSGVVIASHFFGHGPATLAAKEKYASESIPAPDGQMIRAHVKFLASDLLEGRGTGQRGGDLAAEYIGAQFESYGLKPAGDGGTFFQNVPMVTMKTKVETSFSLEPKNQESGAAVSLKLLDDFTVNNEMQTEIADLDAPIVFVGFGITAPEYNWDDYKGVDLKGKVALLFVNEPISDDPKFFKGKALTYYGRWIYKFEETARHGAVATLIIHRTDLASYGWQVIHNSLGTDKSFLKLDGHTPKLKAASWIQLDVAKKIAAMSGMDIDKMYQQAQSRDFKPVKLPVSLKAHVVSEIHPFMGKNVVAKLPGGDAKRTDEAVMYSAHYDHLGIHPDAEGDQIYNGAVDNATGCGILLEAARVWSMAKPAPARSILFAAVTGEEQGLLGSEFLGKHLPIPAGKISLDLNYDALAPIGDPEEVDVSGAERTTFYPEVEALAKSLGLAIRPDAHPEAGHYYRSDHFSLARVGIPSFSIGEGQKYKGHDTAWGDAQSKDYVDHHYHQPSDEYRSEWDFSGLAKMTQFGVLLGQKAASAPALQGWQPGDEFEAPRKKSAAAAIIGPNLFSTVPGLQVAYFEPINYPPLARQTRISGSVPLHVKVDETGSVIGVALSEDSSADNHCCHPLLTPTATGNIAKWKFDPPGRVVEFDLHYDFVLTFDESDAKSAELEFAEPLHIRVAGAPSILNT